MTTKPTIKAKPATTSTRAGRTDARKPPARRSPETQRPAAKRAAVLPALAGITSAIIVIRGHRVMLDTDLAALYQVPTKALNQAVKRNRERFPDDFMFQLSVAEVAAIRSQSVTGSHRTANARPYVFTEQGVAMLSSVLHSARAAQVNVAIMRAFVAMRRVLAGNVEIVKRLEHLEQVVRENRTETDGNIRMILDAIQALMADADEAAPGKLGFALE